MAFEGPGSSQIVACSGKSAKVSIFRSKVGKKELVKQMVEEFRQAKMFP